MSIRYLSGINVDSNTLFVDSANDRVGIGTNSPSRQLELVGSDAYIQLTRSSTSFQATLGFNTGATNDWLIRTGDGSTSNLQFYSYGTSSYVMTIARSSGNVGIGTTSPGTLLHLVQSSGPTIRLVRTSNRFDITADNDFMELNARDASTYMIFKTADTERMRITSGGSLLIGSTTQGYNPQTQGYLLGVKSDTTQAFISIAKSGQTLDTEGMIVGLDSTTGYVWMRQNVDITFGTNNTTKVTIAAAGNVGIGTTAPNEKLDVNGDVTLGWSANRAFKIKYYGGGTYEAGMRLASGTRRLELFSIFDDAAEGISFTTGTGASNSEKMRLTNAGNLGIGTDSPSYSLDVAGTSRSDLHIFRSNQSAPTADAFIFRPADNTVALGTANSERIRVGSSEVWFKIGSSTTGYEASFSNDDNGFNIYASRYGGTGKYLTLNSTGAVENMRLTSNGNVGIGTTSPAYKLQVDGSTGVRNGSFYIGDESGSTNSAVEFYKSGTTIRMYTNTGAFGGTYGATSASLTLYSGSAYSTLINGNGDSYFNAGSLGIGTTSPNAPLHIVKDLGTSVSAVLRLRGSNSTARTTRLQFEDYNGTIADGLIDFIVPTAGSSTGARLDIGVDSTIMSLVKGGNVGIGTTSPEQKLHVKRTETVNRTSYTDILTIDADANNSPYSGHGGGILFRGTTYSGGGNNIQGNRIWGRIGMFLNDFYDGFNGESMFFAVAPDDRSDTLTTAMTIQYNGNVGIGTTSPSQALHVSGSARVTGAYYDSNNSAGSSGQVLSSTGSGTDWVSLSEITGVDGTGTANYIAKWSDTDTITNSSITDDGTTVTVTATNFVSQSNLGTAYTSFTTSGTTAIFDTITRTDAAIYQIVIVANPNSAGSGSYQDFYYGKVFIGTGYNGSAVVQFINYHQESPMPRGLYGSGGGDLTVTAVMLVSGSEVTEVANGTSYTIRIKIAGYQVAGAGTTVRLQRIM